MIDFGIVRQGKELTGGLAEKKCMTNLVGHEDHCLNNTDRIGGIPWLMLEKECEKKVNYYIEGRENMGAF